MAEDPSNDQLYDFLVGLGTAGIAHTGHDFLTHLKAVQSVLEDGGAEPEIARAGPLHSIYGTEGFQDFSLPLKERAQVQGLIGARAEFAANCNCVMDRSTFDAAVAAAVTDASSAGGALTRASSAGGALTRASSAGGALTRASSAGGALTRGGYTFEIRDRVEGSPPIALTRAQLADLAEVHLFDWLEQVDRSDRGWGYRREAYRQMAELVGPRAVAAYDAAFAREAAAT